MSVVDELRRNPEHYPDPTAYEAITAVTKEEEAAEQAHRKKKPLVFICSPYRGNIEHNTRRAQKYCRFAISKKTVPFAPHLHYTRFLNDSIRKERNIGISCGVEILKRCDELWVFGDKITEGMAREIEAAKRLGIPVRRVNNLK